MAALFFAAACADSPAAEEVCEDPAAVDREEAVELYRSAWSEEDPAERSCLLQRSLAPDAVLLATTGLAEGRPAVVQELDERLALLVEEDMRREATGAIESRHDEARLAWTSAAPGEAAFERGEDWLEFDEDGRLARIHILAGSGAEAPLSAPLRAWQEAWNARDEAQRTAELSQAATDDVRFTDLVSDVRGRDALGLEIGRQQDAVDGELRLDDRMEVFASMGGQSILIRVPAEIVFSQGGSIRVVDYIRLRDGRVERLSGFPRSAE